ncbi:DUF421 domain-containing protein [Agrococcus sp. Ld7]|uniref:DUF421 domain-containing protein n=1 Tax=Agrococcus sp. Ld7 TaxID=649148 RepID=UPI0038645608
MDDLWFYLGIPPLAALAVVISTAGLYGTFLLLSRVLGQRVLARLSGFDLLVVIVFGAIIGRAILGHVPTFAAGLVAMATLLVLEGAIGMISRKGRLQALVHNRPVLLMAGSQLVATELRRCHVTVEEVHSQLRRAGIRSQEEVAAVILEPTGELSVVRRGVPMARSLLAGVRSAERMPEDLLADA